MRAFVRPDEEIAGEIRELFEREEINPSSFTCEVQDGEVRVRGIVEWETTVESLPEAISRIPGVVTIDCQLTAREHAAAP